MLTRLKKKGERAAFAKKLGVSDQVLSNWTRRGVPPGKVHRVATLLGIPYEQYMREAGHQVNVANQERAQYTLERAQLMEDFDQLPSWLQSHIVRKTRELRSYADALPGFVRDSIKAPPADVDAYRKWEREMEADMLRLIINGGTNK